MKFKFKIQQYQTDAVENTVEVFNGQPSYSDAMMYRRDLGKRTGVITYADDDVGYCNREVELSSKNLLDNINAVQIASPRLAASGTNSATFPTTSMPPLIE